MPDLIPKHGGYRRLKSFQIGQLIYDLTVRFCELYIDRKSRTRDQMVQGRPLRGAEHRRRQPGLRHFQEERVETD